MILAIVTAVGAVGIRLIDILSRTAKCRIVEVTSWVAHSGTWLIVTLGCATFLTDNPNNSFGWATPASNSCPSRLVGVRGVLAFT